MSGGVTVGAAQDELLPLSALAARARLGLAGSGTLEGDPRVLALPVQDCAAVPREDDALFAAWLRLVQGPVIVVVSAGEQVGFIDRVDALALVGHLRAVAGADAPCVLAGQGDQWRVYVQLSLPGS